MITKPTILAKSVILGFRFPENILNTNIRIEIVTNDKTPNFKIFIACLYNLELKKILNGLL